MILFIGDGMGEAEVSLARYYAKGATGRLNMDSLRFRGDITTYNLSPAPQLPYPPNYVPYPPNYVPDSAPTGTAWSTGKKTIDGRLSQGPSAAPATPGSNEGYTTYLEIAKARAQHRQRLDGGDHRRDAGRSLVAHLPARLHGPERRPHHVPDETKAAGGLGSIAEQQADNGFDVTLGGARARYEQPLVAGGTETVVDYAKSKNFKYVTSRTDLAAVTRPRAGPEAPGPVRPGQHDHRVRPADRVRRGLRLGHDEVHAPRPRH